MDNVKHWVFIPLVILFTFFSGVVAFASSTKNPLDSFPHSDDLGSSWIAYVHYDSNGEYESSYVFKVKNDDISNVTSSSISFTDSVTYYVWRPSSWTKAQTTTGLTGIEGTDIIYISGLDSSKFTSLSVPVHKESIGTLNFHQPSLAETQQVSLATMTKDFSLNSSVILKIVLVAFALLLVASLIPRVIRSFL